MKYNYIIFVCVFLIAFINCTNKENDKEYYVISEHSNYGDTVFIKGREIPPPPLPGQEYYTNLVIVFDSTDRVYLYQTINTSTDSLSTRDIHDFKNLIKYPMYIGLHPYNLITFSSINFLQFIKDNNYILELDTLRHDRGRYFIIASNKDTIENNAYYNLIDLIKPKIKDRMNRYVLFSIRKTTEEENNVIFCKRRNIEYDPQKIKWSTKFINGHCSPFTKEYDSIVKRMTYTIKANSTISTECTIVPTMHL